MPSCPPNAVACFQVWDAAAPSDAPSIIFVQAKDEFYLGRSEKHCRYFWCDPHISNRHLRIHSIVYDEDVNAGVPPLIYAEDLSTNGTHLKRCVELAGEAPGVYEVRMRAGFGAVLLSNRDELRISPRLLLKYVSLPPRNQSEAVHTVQEIERQLMKDSYLITDRKIGAGGHGDVFVALHRKSQRQLACKIIDIRQPEADPEMLDPCLRPDVFQQPASENWKRMSFARQFREFDILKDLCHPNIIGLEKVFWSNNTIYIFQELITGGDLFSYIESKGGRFSDVEAAIIIYQILRAVEFLHDRDIVHRDLKPDNILMTKSKDGARIVLTDFGNARYLPHVKEQQEAQTAPKRRMFSVVGTHEYAAPEVYMKNDTIKPTQGYSKAVDMWSIGSIACSLLTGDVIFVDREHPNWEIQPGKVVLDLSAQCNLEIMNYGHMWSKVGARPKDFVKKLLVLDESRRMTVRQALNHSWLTNKRYTTELHAVYDRAIRAWRPRRKVFKLIESLETKTSRMLISHPTNGRSVSSHQPVVSQYFQQRHPPMDLQLARARRAPNKHPHTPLPAIAEEVDAWNKAVERDLPVITDSFNGPATTDTSLSPETHAAVELPFSNLDLLDGFDVPATGNFLPNQNVPFVKRSSSATMEALGDKISHVDKTDLSYPLDRADGLPPGPQVVFDSPKRSQKRQVEGLDHEMAEKLSPGAAIFALPSNERGARPLKCARLH